jgi:histidine triad (HIT) family protein
MTTIFSKIISKEVPADIVYEDEFVLAFLDINPVQLGHTLVIPKIPSPDGLSCSVEDLARVMVVAQKISLALKEVTACDGVNFIMNNGASAGQEVFHTHLHVIPRFTDDGVFEKPLHSEYEDGEATSLAVALAQTLLIN